MGYILESRFPAAVVWRKGLVTIYNDAFAPILGNKPEAMGRSFAHIWGEVWDQIGPIANKAFAGEATYIEDYELTIHRRDQPEKAWFTFCYSPLRLADGTIAGMMDTVVETTAVVRTRQQLHALNIELGHRLKNSMALAHALAAQSLKPLRNEETVQSFLKRLEAIGHAQTVLLDPSASDQTLSDLVATVLSPLDGLHQIRAEGPDVMLGPQCKVSIAMVLYELATNAAKYGALSMPSGKVIVKWNVDGDNLSFSWREAGGPFVSEPKKLGLGSRLIDGGFCSGSKVRRWYPAEGFQVQISTGRDYLRR